MISGKTALTRLLQNNELFYDEMSDLMRQIMMGQLDSDLVAGLLVALRMKVETVSEITASVNVLKEFSVKVPVQNNEYLLDIVGTGGDGAKTFNISTTSMFVAAAAGAKIAKHGGKAVSSSSGAADVIDVMGVNIDLSPAQIAASISATNIGFMFAPKHNQAMKNVAPIRNALGIRTIFNILGPLTNPANAKNQLLGVFHPDLLGICANVGKQMQLNHMLVVHGSDGLDEITTFGTTKIAELIHDQIQYYEIHPEDYGFPLSTEIADIQANSAQESLVIMDQVLSGRKGTARDIVLLNAGAAIYCAGVAASIEEGINRAKEAIDSQQALIKKQQFIDYTNSLKS